MTRHQHKAQSFKHRREFKSRKSVNKTRDVSIRLHLLSIGIQSRKNVKERHDGLSNQGITIYDEERNDEYPDFISSYVRHTWVKLGFVLVFQK